MTSLNWNITKQRKATSVIPNKRPRKSKGKTKTNIGEKQLYITLLPKIHKEYISRETIECKAD